MPDEAVQLILAELRRLKDEVATLRAVVNRGRVKYDLDAAADRLGVSRRTVERRIEAGQLGAVREGARVFVTEEACAAYEDRARRRAA